jgi:hypothetical protein
MEMVHHNDAFSASGTPIAGDDCIEAFTQGEGNVSVDPVFTQGEGGSMWQLDPDSPLIDQGDNKVVKQLRRDIRGVPRIVDGGLGPVVDMGAFEYLPK